MISGGSHIKYARALLKVADKASAAEHVMKDLTELSLLFRDESFKNLIKRITYLDPVKIEKTFEAVFRSHFHAITMNMLIMLARSRKLGLVTKIYDTYRHLYHEAKNIQEYLVRTARKLSPDEEVTLIDRLQQKGDKPVSVRFEHRADLIGGMQIYERGYLTDYSLKNYLETLRKNLLSASN
jgi:ATP synthase F1 delta subunit